MRIESNNCISYAARHVHIDILSVVGYYYQNQFLYSAQTIYSIKCACL